MTQNMAAHPLGWPGSRWLEQRFRGNQSPLLLTHLVAQPWGRGYRNQTLSPVYRPCGL